MPQREPRFKLEFNEKETITGRAGLGIYGELYKSSGVYEDIKRLFPLPGSGNGYKAHWHIYPVVLTIIDGGEHLEDICRIGCDQGLRKIGHIEEVPSADAVGEWLKRESGNKVEWLNEVNNRLNEKMIKRAEKELTLDIDAFEVIGNKETARWNYQGNRGYMPLAGFIPEIGCCIGSEFREGNVSPATDNYGFSQRIYERVARLGKRIKDLRSDSAGYNSQLMNYVRGQDSYYCITADQDVAVKAGIRNIKEVEWKKISREEGFAGSDREYAEFVHSTNKTDHSFRIIVQRWLNRQVDLFKETETYCYHGIATNYLAEEKNAVEIIRWHNGRSNSENYNKELKLGFSLKHVPCGDFNGNAVWFGLVILAYNLFIASKIFLFPASWRQKTIRTIRYEFIRMAGKVMIRSRQMVLRICSTLRETFDLYVEARQRCWELRQDSL